MNKLLRFVLAAVFVGSAACFKTIIEVVPPQHVPTELQIMLNGANMSGKTINTVATSPLPLTARLVDGDGVEMGLPTPVQFSSSDTNVVVVDFAGLATARRSGSARIFARLPLGTRELTNSVSVTYACSAAFVLGLSVTITDSLTGAVSSVASRWHVRDVLGTFADSGSGIGGLVSAGERAGTYHIDISTPGYRDWMADGVVVTRDQCHVKSVALTARLQRTS